MPSHFSLLHFHSLNNTSQRAMNAAAIACASVEYNMTDLYFYKRDQWSCLGLTSQIWTQTRVNDAFVALRGGWFIDWKCRKVMGITTCFCWQKSYILEYIFTCMEWHLISLWDVLEGKFSFNPKLCDMYTLFIFETFQILIRMHLFKHWTLD